MMPHFTPRQIDAFLAVAELQSFRLAASRIHLSTSAISTLISELERSVGFQLFDRTTRRVALTREGRQFLPSATAVQRQIAQTANVALDIRLGSAYAVRVAAPLVVASTLLPRLIASRPEPDVIRVQIVDTPVVWLADRIAIGDADLAIGPDRECSGHIEQTMLSPTPWMLWMRADHPLAKLTTILWSSLHTVPLVAAGRDHEQSVWPKVAATGGATPQNVLTVEHITTSLGLAAQGIVATFAPDYVLPIASAFGLIGRPLVEPDISRSLCLYTPTGNRIDPAVEKIADHIRTAAAGELRTIRIGGAIGR